MSGGFQYLVPTIPVETQVRTLRVHLDNLQPHNADYLLDQLNGLKENHNTDRQYQLWREGSHPQQSTERK